VSDFEDFWNWHDSCILTRSCEHSRFLKNQSVLHTIVKFLFPKVKYSISMTFFMRQSTRSGIRTLKITNSN
jgi:hypothetical protein